MTVPAVGHACQFSLPTQDHRAARRTAAVVSLGDVVRVQDFVVVRLAEGIGVARPECQIALEVGLETGERERAQQGGGAGLAHDGDEVGEAGHPTM